MVFDRSIITKNAKDSQNLGAEVANYIKTRGGETKIVCLYGDLGSGKTTFSQGFAKALGITSRLLSPTFIIVRRYLLPEHSVLFHIDLYRIEKDTNIHTLGLEEIFRNPDAYVLIEWAERLGSFLPKKRIDMTFEVIGDDERKIRIKETND